MKKRLFSVLLACGMVLALLPAAALATSSSDYGLWVGGVGVTSSASTGVGWSYTSASNTLTLTGANISDCYSINDIPYDTNTSVAGIYADGDLNIVLVGNNTITATATNLGYSSGVYVGGALTISGSGSLTATGGAIESTTNFISSGIFASGSITINSGTITATAGNTTIAGSQAGGAYGTGLLSFSSLTINNGTVIANGGTAEYQSTGAGRSSSPTTVNGGSLEATGGTVNGTNQAYSYGILGSLTLNNGSVKATGGAVSTTLSPHFEGSSGLRLRTSPLNIDGGTLIATGRIAIDSDNGNLHFAGHTWRSSSNGTFVSDPLTASELPTLTYVEITINPAPAPSSGDSGGSALPAIPTVYNSAHQSGASIWLSGSGLSHSDLLVTQDIASDNAHRSMLQLADREQVLGMYDISLQSGKSSTGSAMHLTFSLPREYAGEQLTLVHQKADGALEYYYAAANAGGRVKFGPIFELSPFLLVKGTLLQAPEQEVVDAPKTGDSPNLLGLMLLGLAAVSAIGAAACQKRRRTRKA